MKIIPYSRQSITEEDIEAVCAVLRSDWLTQGPKVREFEEALAHECGAKHCVVVANGTMALHLACLALDVGNGDLGITSPITFLASANCIAYCGGRVDFADIDPGSLCLSPDRVEEYCKEVAVPKVVIPVDFAGVPADLQRFKDLSERFGFRLIEDAAHSLGSTYEYEGRKYSCGSCGHTDLAILSFHPVKTITTGEGGAVLTNDDRLADKLRCLASHGVVRDPSRFVSQQSATASNLPPSRRATAPLRRDGGQPPTSNDSSLSFASNLQPPTSNDLPPANPWYYEMQLLGFNARITDIQCALGLSQLRRLQEFKAKRQEIVRMYNSAFEDLAGKGMVILPPWPEGTDPCYHLYPFRLGPSCRISRNDLFNRLREKGIYCQVHYIPVYRQPYYREKYDFRIDRFPESESYFSGCISLPLYLDLHEQTFDFILATLKSFIGLRHADS